MASYLKGKITIFLKIAILGWEQSSISRLGNKYQTYHLVNTLLYTCLTIPESLSKIEVDVIWVMELYLKGKITIFPKIAFLGWEQSSISRLGNKYQTYHLLQTLLYTCLTIPEILSKIEVDVIWVIAHYLKGKITIFPKIAILGWEQSSISRLGNKYQTYHLVHTLLYTCLKISESLSKIEVVSFELWHFI